MFKFVDDSISSGWILNIHEAAYKNTFHPCWNGVQPTTRSSKIKVVAMGGLLIRAIVAIYLHERSGHSAGGELVVIMQKSEDENKIERHKSCLSVWARCQLCLMYACQLLCKVLQKICANYKTDHQTRQFFTTSAKKQRNGYIITVIIIILSYSSKKISSSTRRQSSSNIQGIPSLERRAAFDSTSQQPRTT